MHAFLVVVGAWYASRWGLGGVAIAIVGAQAAAALWLTAGHVRAIALPVGLTLFIEVLVWIAAIIAALYYAPSFVRPMSVHWAMTNMPFDVLGAPGRYLRKGLKWLDKDH